MVRHSILSIYFICLQVIVEFVQLDIMGILVAQAAPHAAGNVIPVIIARSNRHPRSSIIVEVPSKICDGDCTILLMCVAIFVRKVLLSLNAYNSDIILVRVL